MKSTSVSSNTRLFPGLVLAGVLACLVSPLPTLSQGATATLEFFVQATPSGGRPEKVMQHPFYLLRQSLAEIERLARGQTSAPDRDAFINDLSLSDELKEWMKRTGVVDLRGDHFRQALTTDDIMAVEELRAAYLAANMSMIGLGFPRPKVKLSDRTKNPERWERRQTKYWEKVRSYLELHPESLQHLDEQLLDLNPGQEWAKLKWQHERAVRRETERLIYSHFLVSRTETSLQGFARFNAVPPGRYWLTNLWKEARAGDVRLRWELPVELRPGQTLTLELNNANARYQP